MVIRKINLFIFFYFLSLNSLADDLIDIFVESKMTDFNYLYISDVSEITNLDSVVYILMNDNHNYDFEKFFIQYATTEISENTGGIILNRSNPNYFYYIKASTCDFTKTYDNLIIYDNKTNGLCYYFHAKSVDDLYNAMKSVDDLVKNITNVAGEYTKTKFKDSLLALDNPVINILINDIVSLYDKFILSYLPPSSSSGN